MTGVDEQENLPRLQVGDEIALISLTEGRHLEEARRALIPRVLVRGHGVSDNFLARSGGLHLGLASQTTRDHDTSNGTRRGRAEGTRGQGGAGGGAEGRAQRRGNGRHVGIVGEGLGSRKENKIKGSRCTVRGML